MTLRGALAAVVQLFTMLLLFAIGAFCLGVALSEKLQFRAAEALIEYAPMLCPIGWSFLAAACLLFALFYSLHRKPILRVRAEKHSLSLDLNLLRKAIDERLKRQFADLAQLAGLEVMGGKTLEIGVMLAFPEETNRDREIELVYQALKALLAERFDCSHEIILSVSTAP